MSGGQTSGTSWHPWDRLVVAELQRGGAILQDVYRHASEEYPNECCGFIRTSGQVHRGSNYQDILHADDPVKWPRSAREAYCLAPDDVYLLGLSFLSEDPAIVVYHSHPDVGAYFSDKDERDALVAGRPIYEVDHLVVDVRLGRSRGAKLYRFLDSKFACVWSQEIAGG